MEYSDYLEHYAGMGYSAADARTFADNGIVPRGEPDEDEEEQDQGCTCRGRDCTC